MEDNLNLLAPMSPDFPGEIILILRIVTYAGNCGLWIK
jgi:hypothetical protein